MRQWKRPWAIKYRDCTNFSLGAVILRRFDVNSIHRNPTKFTKVYGQALGNPAVNTAYVKVFYIQYVTVYNILYA